MICEIFRFGNLYHKTIKKKKKKKLERKRERERERECERIVDFLEIPRKESPDWQLRVDSLEKRIA